MEEKLLSLFYIGDRVILQCTCYLLRKFVREQLHLDCMNLSAVATKPSSGGFISEIILSPIYKKLLTTSEHLILITLVNWDAKFCRQL